MALAYITKLELNIQITDISIEQIDGLTSINYKIVIVGFLL